MVKLGKFSLRRILTEYWAYGLFSILYLYPRVYTLIRHGVFLEPDTGGYRTYEEGFGFTEDLARVDFLGDAFRPFPVNFIYAVVPSDAWRVTIQIAFGLSAWTYLLATMNNRNKKTKSHLLLFSLITFSPSLVYRDLCILPDSLSLSLLVLIIGLVVHGLETSKLRRGLILFLMVILAIQRPTIWIPMILTAVALLVLTRNLFSLSKTFIIFSLCLSAILGCTYNTVQSERGWPKYFDTRYEVSKNAFPIGLLIWEDNIHREKWRAALTKANFPKCGELSSADKGPWEYSVRVFGNCETANTWLKQQFYRFFLNQMLTNPSLVMDQIVTEFPKAFIPSPDPYIVEDITGFTMIPDFPTFSAIGMSSLEGINYRIANNPFFIWIPFWFWYLRRRLIEKSLNSRVLGVQLGVGLSILIGIFSNNLVMPSDTFRHNMPSNYLLLILSLFIVLNYGNLLNLKRKPPILTNEIGNTEIAN